ncbi:MAG: DUF4164 family protein [Rhizobiaceae bacterium]|nr:DUF4164 family protein [Rhizobiaceae bacterium]
MSDLQSNLTSDGETGGGLGTALARLNKALDSLDNAVDASLESTHTSGSSGEEVQRMAEDRAKLAQELDSSEDRAKRLEATNREVSRRLVAAMETVRGVLDQPV